MTLAAVLFDKDGVVLDSESIKRPTYVQLARQMFDLETTAGDFAWAVGLSFEDTARGLAERFRSLNIIDPAFEPAPGVELGAHMIRLRKDLDRMAYPEGPPLMEGLLDLLAMLNANEIPCGLATSDYWEVTKAMMEARDIHASFGVVVTRDFPAIHRPKPDPEIFLVAAHRLGVSIKDCVVIDDSPPGIEAAHSAGARSIYVADRRVAPPDDQAMARAVATVASLREVGPIVRGMIEAREGKGPGRATNGRMLRDPTVGEGPSVLHREESHR